MYCSFCATCTGDDAGSGGLLRMPTYEFKCEKCKKKFTLVMSVKDYGRKRQKCPKCGSLRVEQLIQPFFAVTSKKS